jgi:hypothetical protein
MQHQRAMHLCQQPGSSALQQQRSPSLSDYEAQVWELILPMPEGRPGSWHLENVSTDVQTKCSSGNVHQGEHLLSLMLCSWQQPACGHVLALHPFCLGGPVCSVAASTSPRGFFVLQYYKWTQTVVGMQVERRLK